MGGSTRFSITQLAEFLYQFAGQGGMAVYSVGFIAAALSSTARIRQGPTTQPMMRTTSREQNPTIRDWSRRHCCPKSCLTKFT